METGQTPGEEHSGRRDLDESRDRWIDVFVVAYRQLDRGTSIEGARSLGALVWPHMSQTNPGQAAALMASF